MRKQLKFFVGLICLSLSTCLAGASPGQPQGGTTAAAAPAAAAESPFKLSDIEFRAHDGVEMFGRLALPKEKPPRAILIYVHTAEGSTVEMKRPLSGGKTFNYYDLYRKELAARNIGFFSYEGRGIRMGSDPPKFQTVDREVFNTSTLDNKVRDVQTAIETVRKQPGLARTPILLMGASEGTLIAVEAASKNPNSVAGLVLYGVLASNMRQNFMYIMTDGSFLPSRPLDKDGDGSVTQSEWDAAFKGVDLKGIDFSKVDQNRDGLYNAADFAVINKKYVDAINNQDFQVLDEWASQLAGVVTPDHWFKDHFSHAEMWTFLKDLNVPVGLFHGDRDAFTSVPALKEMETKATAAGRTNLKFHYFDGLEHSLNIGEYFAKGTMPKGHQAIFEFIEQVAPK